MKVAVYQTSPVLLDVRANMDDVISKIHKGREKGAELIVFPELALTGYFVGQNYHEAALRLDSEEVNQIALATKGTSAIVGFIEESFSMNIYNSALVAVERARRVATSSVHQRRLYRESGVQERLGPPPQGGHSRHNEGS